VRKLSETHSLWDAGEMPAAKRARNTSLKSLRRAASLKALDALEKAERRSCKRRKTGDNGHAHQHSDIVT
jgi:hypothetical protein